VKFRAAVSFFLFLAVAFAKTKDNGRPPCSVLYSVLQRDELGNVQEGLANAKKVKWAGKDLEKKYPDVCYLETDQERARHPPTFEIINGDPPPPPMEVTFWITVTPATYHGTRVVTTTNQGPQSGTVNDTGGEQIGTYQGTTTSTSSTAVPYSFEYGKFMLIIEEVTPDGKAIPRHIFQQDGIYRVIYGIPLGGRGHHPVEALIEDAVKWIHAGGLEDPHQSVPDLSK